jgi:hypothetical protein
MAPFDLTILVEAIAQAAVGGLQQVAADAAAQVAQGAPPMPQIPAPPAAPLAWPDTKGLNEVLINLGGWAAILKWVFSSVANKIDARFKFFEVRVKRMERSLNQLVSELRRLRHAPPIEAYRETPRPTHRPRRHPEHREHSQPSEDNLDDQVDRQEAET